MRFWVFLGESIWSLGVGTFSLAHFPNIKTVYQNLYMADMTDTKAVKLLFQHL